MHHGVWWRYKDLTKWKKILHIWQTQVQKSWRQLIFGQVFRSPGRKQKDGKQRANKTKKKKKKKVNAPLLHIDWLKRLDKHFLPMGGWFIKSCEAHTVKREVNSHPAIMSLVVPLETCLLCGMKRANLELVSHPVALQMTEEVSGASDGWLNGLC